MEQKILTWSYHDGVDLTVMLKRILNSGDNIQCVTPTQYGTQSPNTARIIAATIIVNVLK